MPSLLYADLIYCTHEWYKEVVSLLKLGLPTWGKVCGYERNVWQTYIAQEEINAIILYISLGINILKFINVVVQKKTVNGFNCNFPDNDGYSEIEI